MAYKVGFECIGFTAPTPENPKGVRVVTRGEIDVPGDRPKDAFGIPSDLLWQIRDGFMEKTGCVRMKGDEPGNKQGPTYWLKK